VSTIARGTAINLATRVLAMGLGVALTVITARLGTREQGMFAIFAALESALLALGSGFGVLIARRISHHRERPAALVGAVVVACIACGAIAALALAALALHSGPDYGFLAVLAWGAPLLLLAPNLLGIWLGIGRMEAMARVTLATPLLTLSAVVAVLTLRGEVGLPAVLWCWVAARSIVGIATLGVAWRGGWVGSPSAGGLGIHWRFVAVIGMANLIGLLNYKVDLFLVERLIDLSTTGVYSVAVLVAELLWVVSTSVSQAAYARIGNPDPSEASRVTLRAMHASLIALALLSVPLWLLAAWLLPLLLGAAYAAAMPALAILLPGVVVYGAASALSAYFTNHAGRPYVPASIAAMSLVSTVAFSLLLVPAWGMLGAATATTVSYIGSVAVAAMVFSWMSELPLRHVVRPDWQALKGDFGHLRALVTWPKS